MLKHLAWAGLAGLALCCAPLLLAQQKSTEEWEVLTGCQLVTNAVVDGDSFHVRHDGREYIFRLYFVDAPESDPTLKDRAKDQAAYFGISPEDIPRAGQLAAQFTRAALTGTEFTITTRWRNAQGRSALARFYGIVHYRGKNLAEELVANGIARIYGLRANWPDGPRATTFINQLKNLELTAREKKLGVWDEARFPRQGAAPTERVASTNSPPAKVLVDVNHASLEELQKLPGIGPKLAERILAHRPYEKPEDLDKVPGIGSVLLGRLKPLIRCEPAAP